MREFLVPGILVKEIIRKKYYKERVFHVKVEIHQRVELKKIPEIAFSQLRKQ